MIYLFDKDERLIRIVSRKAVKTALQKFSLTTEHYVSDRLTVEMKALPDPVLERVEYMAIQALDDRHNFHFFYVAQKHSKGKLTELVGVQSGIEELRKTPVYDKRPKNAFAREVIADLLAGTNWSARFVGETLPRSTNFYYTSVFDALKKVCQVWDLEMQFFVQMNGNEIGGRFIDFKKKIGMAVGKRVVYGHNALQILQEVERTNLYTALIGRGKGEQVSTAGEDGRQADGYGRKITFEDVVWSRSSGKPVDKPQGQAYVELPAMTAQYGIRQANGAMRPKIGFIEFSEEEDKANLLQRTYEALVDASRPQVTFKTSAVYLKGVAIGDTIRVVRHDRRLDYETRVFELTVNRLDNQSSDIKLGDRITEGQSSRVQSIADQAVEDFVQNEFSHFVQNLPDFLPSADGFNTNWYGADDPTLKYKGKVGINDIWYKPDPEHEGHKIMLRWTGEVWEELVRTYDTEAVRRRVEAAQAKADQVAEQARQSDQKAQQALARAGASENLAQTAKSVADQARASAGQALTNLQSARTALQESITSVQTDVRNQADALANQARNQTNLTSRLTTVEATANGIKSTVTELTKTVDANTGNLTSVTQRVASTESGLAGVRDQYSQVQQSLDTATGEVRSVSQKTADLERGLDGVRERFERIRIGARNFIPDFGFEKSQAFNQHQSEWTFERLADATARSGWQIKATCRRAGGGGFHRLLFDLRGDEWQGKTMTYAVDVKASRPLRLRIGAEAFSGWGKVHEVTTSWQRLSQTGDVAFNQWHSFIWYIAEGSWRVGDVVYLRDPQLEEGSVATTPKPAEEDFRQEFADYVRSADQNLSKLTSIVTSPEGLLQKTASVVDQTAEKLAREFNEDIEDSLSGRLKQANVRIDETAKALTSKLSATDLKPFFDKKGIETGQNLAETFENWEKKTADAIERGLTATKALIPTEFSGNILKNGKQTWRNSRGATYTLDEDMEAGRDYTLTVKYWNGSGGQGVSTNLFGTWQVGSYDAAVDAWVIKGRSATRLSKGHQFLINAHPGTGLGNADWATLTKGPLAMSKYQEPMSNLVTAVDFNKVKETAQLYERVLGRTEGDVATNVARQVMTSQLFQTEVSKQQTDSELLSRLADGVPMTGNKHFATDLAGYNVYDNARTGHVTISRVADQLSPSGYAMMVRTSGSGTAPWLGGFRHEVTTAKNKEFLVRLVAKIPAGRKLYFHNNSLGTGASWRWLSSVDGTGSYATYVAYVKSGYEGPFSSFGFWAIGGGATPTASSPLVWYVSEYQVYDITNSRTEALTTRVTQLADSYAIKTLGDAGQVLSAINLATGGASIQAGQNKLVITPTTTFIQNGTIKSAMIESLDAGKITAGELNAANVDIINLNVGKVKGLDGKFILAEIEKGFIEWMQGKVITAKNGAMAINLNQADVTFRHNATLNFESENNAIVRKKGDVTGFMSFSDDHVNGGVYGVFGVSSSNTGIVTSRHSDGGTFAGLRVYRPGSHLDMIQVVGDKVQLRHSTGDGGHYFEFRPTTLKSNIDMNTMINGIKALAMCFKHVVSNNFDWGQPSLRNAISREVTDFLNATEPFRKI